MLIHMYDFSFNAEECSTVSIYVCARHPHARYPSKVSPTPTATSALVNKLVYFARRIMLS